ncbi:hypothetical protein AABB24_009844 [Solanum stoloniferum]|uniref:Glycine-rich protein n=1 Tax=Solanum stoloniferum TaxID=62892 RepID=A0ABD2UM52_9SOLN
MQKNTSHFILMIILFITPHYLAFNTGGGDGGREMTTSETSPSPNGDESGATRGPNWDYNWGWGSSPGGGWGYGSGSSRSPNGLGRGWGFGFGYGSGSGSGGGDSSGSSGYDSDLAPSISKERDNRG